MKDQPYCTAREIGAWLAAHWARQHVCFTEVKNGPSWGSGMRKMDFMAVQKTWSPVSICGVEIKITRGDFTRDVKWAEYLTMCNQFYWCCPAGMIKKTEIDDRCGLIYAYPEKERVRVVRRALHRDVEPCPATLLYLILWRTEQERRHETDREHVVREMREDKEVGEKYRRFVSRKLQEAESRAEKARLEAEYAAKHAKPVIDFLAKHGKWGHKVERLLRHACEIDLLEDSLADEMKHAHDLLGKIIGAVSTEEAE